MLTMICVRCALSLMERKINQVSSYIIHEMRTDANIEVLWLFLYLDLNLELVSDPYMQ